MAFVVAGILCSTNPGNGWGGWSLEAPQMLCKESPALPGKEHCFYALYCQILLINVLSEATIWCNIFTKSS